MLRSFSQSQIPEISNLVPRVFSFSGKQEDPWGEIGHLLQSARHLTAKQKFTTNNRASEQTVALLERQDRESEIGNGDRGRVIGDR